MNRFLTSSIGKKIVMALTGLFLIVFLVVHCAVNALIFYNDNGVTFNAGAHFMGTNPLIRITEIVLFSGLLLHIYQAFVLTRDNKKARPVAYAVSGASHNSKWYSRSMGLLGTIILMFLIIHLKHFWVVSRFTNELEGSTGHTMFDEMKEVFENPAFVLLYVVAMFSLAYHLLHGFVSAFQTLGLNNKKYTPLLSKVGLVYSIVIPLAFALMPLAMHFGWIH